MSKARRVRRALVSSAFGLLLVPRLAAAQASGEDAIRFQYEAPAELYYPGPDYERSTLYEADLLNETERVELVAYWRREFDRASASGFTHCAGPGKFLSGQQAFEAHVRWADVPPALVEEWAAEHRQRKERPPDAIAEGPE